MDFFSGEDEGVRVDEWLPTLLRASTWNKWSEEELLIQLAGHLNGRALQEWNLLPTDQKQTYEVAVSALQERLDAGGKLLAVQDFRHASQKDRESVAEFIRRLERLFQVAYGRDGLGEETRNALLYSQLQEGLKMELMREAAVSGASCYTSLCLAAKNEERRLAELSRRQHYRRQTTPSQSHTQSSIKANGRTPTPVNNSRRANSSASSKLKVKSTCYNCGEVGHYASACRAPKSESRGRPPPKRPNPSSGQGAGTYRVTTEGAEVHHPQQKSDPLDYLLSSSESEEESLVKSVKLEDSGSVPKCVPLLVQGVPVIGLIDTGADLSIMGGEVFKVVAAVARLRKRDLKKADKTPRTYDGNTFRLQGRLDLALEFDEKTLTTPVYLKMDSTDGLLLSEDVCRQLGIVQYHQEVRPVDKVSRNRVPQVSVDLVKRVNLLPHQSIVAQVRCEQSTGTYLVEQALDLEPASGVTCEPTLICPDSQGLANVVLSNSNGYPCYITAGVTVGVTHPVALVEPRPPDECTSMLEEGNVYGVLSRIDRRRLLRQAVRDSPLLDTQQNTQLLELLNEFHLAFSLEENERGETDLVSMEIHTGDAAPRRVPARRMPLRVRQEVSKHLKEMQEQGVIQPSQSPWESPIVMVQKKDGSHRFCVDYRRLNAVTKLDTYPLPRVDDLLDRLGDARYFTTLDFASGCWQIGVDPGSQEKTAFIVPQGLYEFRVMPFGLSNAPCSIPALHAESPNGIES